VWLLFRRLFFPEHHGDDVEVVVEELWSGGGGDRTCSRLKCGSLLMQVQVRAGACRVAWEEWLRKGRVKNVAADRSEAVQARGGRLGGGAR
jgi:hypothetical protein